MNENLIDSANKTTQSYGSTEPANDKDEEDGNGNFNEDSLRYLPSGEWSSLTTQQKIQKCLLLGCPILVALVIVGGAAYYLARNFGFLYPGEGNENKPTFHTISIPATAPTHAPALSRSSCSLYPECSGLEGLCCPTSEDTMLDCCKR